MIANYEAAVAARFDDLHGRFKSDVADDDPRLLGIAESLQPLDGRRVLDLGCGKGRFARALADRGACMVGLDVSRAMLAGAVGPALDRVRASARRLPFRSSSFDAAIAVEVFEHLAPQAVDDVCAEVRRVLRPGGTFVVVDKNLYAMSAQRPWLPSAAVKWIDQRRGRWMYPHRGPVRERWFRPAGLRRRLKRWFPDVRIVHLLSRRETGRFPFEQIPAARLLVLWAARSPRRNRMRRYAPNPASLPLLLWQTPPGLQLVLAQEGVPFETVKEAHPLAFRGGRFVLFDGRSTARESLIGLLTPEQVAIDVDTLRRGEPCDPFAALVDTRAARASWIVGPHRLNERVARHPKAWIRRRLIARLREAVTRAGGVWIRLASFPYPYRSAFSFRADLDEPLAEDYHRFADARKPLADCCTHFVSTHAYAHHPSVLRDLRDHDTQSHGHFHHVYREPEANRLNLERAHRILRSFGFEPSGFAGPHGRWSPDLDDALEDLGYLYSSDFQLGYDDLPFYPWKGDQFSRILQIPVHPVCEGLFLEAGVAEPAVIGEYLGQVVAARLDAGELAVAYGHPERRLGRMPEVLRILARVVAASPLVWRATFSDLARWWRWRAEQRWLVIPREDHRLDIQFDDWDGAYDFALEIHRGDFYCSLPVTGPRMSLSLTGLAYQRRAEPEPMLDPPGVGRGSMSLKRAVQTAIDWEMVTPLAEIPRSSLPNRVKRGLRWWKLKRAGMAR